MLIGGSPKRKVARSNRAGSATQALACKQKPVFGLVFALSRRAGSATGIAVDRYYTIAASAFLDYTVNFLVFSGAETP